MTVFPILILSRGNRHGYRDRARMKLRVVKSEFVDVKDVFEGGW